MVCCIAIITKWKQPKVILADGCKITDGYIWKCNGTYYRRVQSNLHPRGTPYTSFCCSSIILVCGWSRLFPVDTMKLLSALECPFWYTWWLVTVTPLYWNRCYRRTQSGWSVSVVNIKELRGDPIYPACVSLEAWTDRVVRWTFIFLHSRLMA
jgi:hypothetical protein